MLFSSLGIALLSTVAYPTAWLALLPTASASLAAARPWQTHRTPWSTATSPCTTRPTSLTTATRGPTTTRTTKGCPAAGGGCTASRWWRTPVGRGRGRVRNNRRISEYVGSMCFSFFTSPPLHRGVHQRVRLRQRPRLFRGEVIHSPKKLEPSKTVGRKKYSLNSLQH